jgi:Rne/Rng family ribonuclease
MNKMLIHSPSKKEVHIAVIDNKTHDLLRFNIESDKHKVTIGSIYLGIICRIERSLNAAFVNYGANKDGFLSMKEIHSDYGDIRTGQRVIVQIAKDPRNTKGAYLTTYISLSGYYLVLFPNKDKKHGISRRIVDAERKYVQKILSQISIPGGHVICRTVAFDKQEDDIIKEFSKLKGIWDRLLNKSKTLTKPEVIYEEYNLTNTIIREYIRSYVDHVEIDNKDIYNSILSEIKICSPLFAHKIRYYNHSSHIFEYYKVQKQVQSLFSREVRLVSGGSLVLEQTEALMSIDVNSKHSTKSDNIEETALHTNAEAAKEIFKQILCRNLSGIIAVDFIDMGLKINRTKIEELCLLLGQQDRVRMQITRISKLGIMEISRQRISAVNIASNQTTCRVCSGSGKTDPLDLSSAIVNAIVSYVKKFKSKTIYLTLPINTIIYLNNVGMDAILELQNTHKANLIIIHSTVLSANQFHINEHLSDDLMHSKTENTSVLSKIRKWIMDPTYIAKSIKDFVYDRFIPKSKNNLSDYNRPIRLYPTPSLMEYDEVEDTLPGNHLQTSEELVIVPAIKSIKEKRYPSISKVLGDPNAAVKSVIVKPKSPKALKLDLPDLPIVPINSRPPVDIVKAESAKIDKPAIQEMHTSIKERKRDKIHRSLKVQNITSVAEEINETQVIHITPPVVENTNETQSPHHSMWQELSTFVEYKPFILSEDALTIIDSQEIHTSSFMCMNSNEDQEIFTEDSTDKSLDTVISDNKDEVVNPIALRLGVDINYHPTMYYLNICVPEFNKSNN